MARTLEHVEWSRLVRGKDFGPVWSASGAQGFFGEGYAIHWLLRLLTLFIFFTFRGVTLVAKTTTYPPNKGNMPMKKDGITPKEFLPKCVKGNLRTRAVMNVVGLSGPGAEFLWHKGYWQNMAKPFMISLMSIAKTAEDRLEELRQFVELVKVILADNPHLRKIMAIQLNLSCPNVGLPPELLIKEGKEGLVILGILGIPVIVKFNPLVPVEILVELDQDPNCSGFCLCNTIPWGDLPRSIRRKYFGSTVSPLADVTSPHNQNAGGLSGTDYNRALSCQLIYEARKAGVKAHINGCGGIRHWRHVDEYYWAGASSVSVGSGLSPLAFWRLRSVIRRAHTLFHNVGESYVSRNVD